MYLKAEKRIFLWYLEIKSGVKGLTPPPWLVLLPPPLLRCVYCTLCDGYCQETKLVFNKNTSLSACFPRQLSEWSVDAAPLQNTLRACFLQTALAARGWPLRPAGTLKSLLPHRRQSCKSLRSESAAVPRVDEGRALNGFLFLENWLFNWCSAGTWSFLLTCDVLILCRMMTLWLCLQLLRSSLVNNRTQAKVAEELGMQEFAITNDKTKRPVALRTKTLADLLECMFTDQLSPPSSCVCLYSDVYIQHKWRDHYRW